jgi:hypothetical protein
MKYQHREYYLRFCTVTDCSTILSVIPNTCWLILAGAAWGFRTIVVYMMRLWASLPVLSDPKGSIGCFLFWLLAPDLSGMRRTTISFATAGADVAIIWSIQDPSSCQGRTTLNWNKKKNSNTDVASKCDMEQEVTVIKRWNGHSNTTETRSGFTYYWKEWEKQK